MAKQDIPILVKHMALAIFKSGSLTGTVFDKATSAFNIARHRLVEYGFLTKGSELGPPENIKLTGKGHKGEAKHRRESDARKKVKEWDKLYSLISEAEEEEPDEGAMSPEAEPEGFPPAPATRRSQRRQRRARVAKRRTRRARVPRAKKAKRG